MLFNVVFMRQINTLFLLNMNQQKVVKIESSFCVSSVYAGKLLADWQKHIWLS